MAVGKSVLVIDDSELFRQQLMSLLSELTMGRLSEAADGASGVEAFRSERPDLVLLDIEMPGTGGLDALDQIRKIDPGARVVIVSASSLRANVARAMKSGARHYIRKDTPPERLRGMLKDLLGDAAP